VSSPDREEALSRLTAHPVDVLVVGGGITGCGVALDVATRGYRVGLIDRDDLATGTSSKSSKLVHGGMRYLATGDIAMVAEGVAERERLRRLAPHLVRPLGFVIPVDTRRDAAMLRAGLVLYDAVGTGRRRRRHRRLDLDEVLADAPGLVRGASQGGFRYDDAQTDDARLTLQVAQVARDHGALVAPHVGAVGVLRRGDRVVGVTVRDALTGAEHDIEARWVVLATGVWADHLGVLAPEELGIRLRPAKGVHLVFERRDLPVNRAVVIPSVTDDRRWLFLIPWGQQVYVGTTDTPVDESPDHPTVTAEDAGYLLAAVNDAFGTDLHPVDAIGAWAGYRPLVAGNPEVADLSRRHAVLEPVPGLVMVTGGKLTTYRRMAADTVDRIVAGDGLRRRCRTRRVALGATGAPLEGLARTRAALVTVAGDPTAAGALYHRHGDRADEVVRFAADAGELDPLLPGLPYLTGEVRWAARHELARSLDDVLSRRLRVAIRDREAGGAAIGRVVRILASELGWDEAECARQVRTYLSGVARERGVVPLPGSDLEVDDAR
jgi:glycerol-3-phosphate dehydrogenase